MGKEYKDIPLDLDSDPNWRRYKDTNYYLSRMGDVAKKCKTKNIRMKVFDHEGTYVFKINGQKRINAKRAIYEAFVGQVPKGYLITLKNGAKKDFNVNNMTLTSRKSFNKKIATNNHNVKYILNLDNGDMYKGLKEAEAKTGYSRKTISMYANGRYNSPYIHLKKLDISPYPRMDDEY